MAAHPGNFRGVSETQNPEQVQAAAGGKPPRKWSSPGRLLIIGVLCLALLAGTGLVVVARARSADSQRRQQASAAAGQFLRTWATGNLSALPAQTVGGSAVVATAYASVDRALGIAPTTGQPGTVHPTATPQTAPLPIKVTLGSPTGSGELITVPATLAIDVPGLGTWRDQVRLRVRTSGSKALIDWSPAAIATALK